MLPKPTKKRLSAHQKARMGKVQLTLPEEKKKALERDRGCVLCHTRNNLTFHHVFWHSSERIYDSSRNLFWRGVTLCLPCHSLVPSDPATDQACREYLFRAHPEHYPEEKE